MVLFRLFKRREKTKLDLFERQSNNVKVWDKDKIEKYYGAGLPKLLAKFADLTKKYPAVKLLIVYREKDERKNWYSP